MQLQLTTAMNQFSWNSIWRCNCSHCNCNASFLAPEQLVDCNDFVVYCTSSASPKPHPSKPHPSNMPQAKTEVALQFLESCTAEVALQHSLLCNVDIFFTKSCAATNKETALQHRKAGLQESGASCRFPAGLVGWIQGKKEYTPPPLHPSFLGLPPDPEVTEQKKLWCHRAKKAMVFIISWENKGKGYTPQVRKEGYTP